VVLGSRWRHHRRVLLCDAQEGIVKGRVRGLALWALLALLLWGIITGEIELPAWQTVVPR
jgi:hypothetical protein